MAWEVWWALVLGFAISAVVQAWVPRENCAGAWRLGSSPDRGSDCSGCRVVVLLNDKLFTNLLGVVIIASLFWLTTRALRGQRGEYG